MQCLEDSALDLGLPGRDPHYGYGLVQVDGLVACLLHDGGDILTTTSTAMPTAAPSPETEKVMCSDQRDIYELCAQNLLTNDEWKQCVTCFNLHIPTFDLTSTPCDDINSSICDVVGLCGERYCNKCLAEIELYLQCMVDVERTTDNCMFGCSLVEEAAPEPTVRGPSTSVTTVTPTPLQTDEHGTCGAKQMEFDSCMSSIIQPFHSERCQSCAIAVLPQEESSSLPPSKESEFCRQVNSEVCSSLNECDCGSCMTEAVTYYACEFDLLIPGNVCLIDCTNDTTETKADEQQPLPAAASAPATASQDIARPGAQLSHGSCLRTADVTVASSVAALLAAFIVN